MARLALPGPIGLLVLIAVAALAVVTSAEIAGGAGDGRLLSSSDTSHAEDTHTTDDSHTDDNSNDTDAHAGDSHASGEHADGAHESHSHQHDVMFYLFNALIIGTLVVHVTTYVPSLNSIQPTVATFALGMLYAMIIEAANLSSSSGVFGVSYEMWMAIDPHTLLFTMLPLLLTGDAMTIDTSVARLVYKQCLYLAGPGVLMCTFMTAAFIWAYLPYEWPFLLCLTVGSILAATDPVAVVSLLKELGASPILTVQIQGESLLNDGTAIVVFTCAYDMLKGTTYDVKDMAIFMVKTAIAAWFLGALIGGLFGLWIRSASNRLEHSSIMIQISLTICCAYVSFFLAEGVFGISGVLSTVAASLVLADNMWSSVVSKEAMHEVWHCFEYFGNTTIFFLAGSLTAKSMLAVGFKDYMYLFYIYVVLTMVRGLMLFGSRPILQLLSTDRSPVTIADTVVMTWGGLRGAVGLALAIQVRVERANGMITEEDADRVLFYVGGIASFTLLLNATTCPLVVDWLGITQTSTTKKHVLVNIHQQLQALSEDLCASPAILHVINEKLLEIEHHICPEGMAQWADNEASGARSNFLRDTVGLGGLLNKTRELLTADTGGGMFLSGEEIVDMLTQARELYNSKKEQLEVLGGVPAFPLIDEEDKMAEFVSQNSPDPGLLKALNEAFLTLVRAQYWHMIEASFYAPGTTTADLLLNSISNAIHHSERGLLDLNFVEHQLQLKPLVARPEKIVVKKRKGCRGWIYNKASKCWATVAEVNRRHSSDKLVSMIPGSNVIAEATSSIEAFVRSGPFQACIMTLIIVNTVCILAEDPAGMRTAYGWLVSDIIFAMLFLVEFILKFKAYGKRYFSDAWNVLDFTCVILSFLALGFRMLIIAGLTSLEHFPTEAELLRINRLFRIMRIMRAATIFNIGRILYAQYQHKRIVISPGFARRMDIIQAMRAFAIAHIHSHNEFLKYFGDNGSLVSVEEIHVLLESRTAVYLALTMAAMEGEKTNPEVMDGLNVLNQTTEITAALSKFVCNALNAGVISATEAEVVTHPLKEHEIYANLIRADCHIGLEHAGLAHYKEHALKMKEIMDKEKAERSPSKRSFVPTVPDGSPATMHHNDGSEMPSFCNSEGRHRRRPSEESGLSGSASFLKEAKKKSDGDDGLDAAMGIVPCKTSSTVNEDGPDTCKVHPQPSTDATDFFEGKDVDEAIRVVEVMMGAEAGAGPSPTVAGQSRTSGSPQHRGACIGQLPATQIMTRILVQLSNEDTALTQAQRKLMQSDAQALLQMLGEEGRGEGEAWGL